MNLSDIKDPQPYHLRMHVALTNGHMATVQGYTPQIGDVPPHWVVEYTDHFGIKHEGVVYEAKIMEPDEVEVATLMQAELRQAFLCGQSAARAGMDNKVPRCYSFTTGQAWLDGYDVEATKEERE